MDAFEQLTFREIVLALLYFKPASGSFKEEAFMYGMQQASKEFPQLQPFFQQESSEGSCGSTHTTLDTVLEGLRPMSLAFSSDYERSYVTQFGRSQAMKLMPQYGQQLRPIAQAVWTKAIGYSI